MKKDRNIANYILVFVLFCYLPILAAFADTAIIITPAPNDLQEREAIEVAAEFFAVKCGTTKEALLTAEWECYFGNMTHYGEGNSEPRWSITIHHSPNEWDPWPHFIELSRQGELLYWEAHDNMGFFIAEPNLLSESTYAQPLDTDVQAEDIIRATQKALLLEGAYSPQEVEMSTYETHFVYNKNFSDGKIPAWLVYIVKEGSIEWKALYGYNGYAISLVPQQQDFISYFLPGEHFWDDGFWEGSTESYLMAGIMDGSMPLEERVMLTERWRPYLERWIKEHPYYTNNPGPEYDFIIHNQFGIPDANSLAQEEAIHIATEEAVRLGCDRDALTGGRTSVYYYVTNPIHPTWQVLFFRIRSNVANVSTPSKDIMNYSSCSVWIDAYSGEIIDASLNP